MLRSLFTAVTGVRAHQTMLDVTGNNIANANTTGFKKDFTIFADMMYQSQKYASGAGDTRGGVNPAQVGLGVSVSAIETIHTQGSASYTGNPSDMMIQGRGFFVYRSGTQNYYSRSGATVLDANSDLVQAGTGNYLQGYEITEDPLDPTQYVRASDLSNVNIQLGKKIDPKATSEVRFQCNLDSRSKPYLPYGFPDLPFNTNAGLSAGNTSGTAKVVIDDIECELSFQTDLTSANGQNYLTITITDGVTPATIAFDMTGINDDGTPILTPQSGTVTIGTAPNERDLTINYDDSTGLLMLRNSADENVFQNNLKMDMNYTSFSIVDTSTSPYTYTKVLAEFNEAVIPSGSQSELAETGATLTMWFPNGTSMGQMTAQVYFNPDGTFASVNPVEGTFPENVTADNFIISASDNGQYLQIRQDKNLTDPSGSYQDLAQINIGGHHSTKTTIYDDLGNQHTLEVNFKKLTENRWRWEAFLVTDDATIEYNVGIPDPNCGEIEFNGDGTINNVVSSDGTRHSVSDGANVYMEIDVPFSMDGSENSTVLLNFGGGIGKNAGDVLNGVTQFASETTTKAVYQDGYPMGVLENFSIGQDGTITGAYSNGKNIPLYRVAIATFANEQGLEKIGDTMFRETANSGSANIDPAQVNGKGTIISQTLEMSNVDLTEEFTHLIIAQRGFQANTRVITTSDQILEEVVNLKR
ncbi:MAG: flagellar hook-basal body complex protein [Synergistaceae bacterium]|nr:flagellar hook-basal body complex protein [Synergistaceae bacterium]